MHCLNMYRYPGVLGRKKRYGLLDFRCDVATLIIGDFSSRKVGPARPVRAQHQVSRLEKILFIIILGL